MSSSRYEGRRGRHPKDCSCSRHAPETVVSTVAVPKTTVPTVTRVKEVPSVKAAAKPFVFHLSGSVVKESRTKLERHLRESFDIPKGQSVQFIELDGIRRQSVAESPPTMQGDVDSEEEPEPEAPVRRRVRRKNR